MKVSELIEHLEQVETEHGDLHVGATCDGWLPPEVAVEVQANRQTVVLYGCRDVDSHVSRGVPNNSFIVNAEDKN